jgi:hypothetical protein
VRRILAGVVAAGVLCLIIGPAPPGASGLPFAKTTAYVFDEDEVTIAESAMFSADCWWPGRRAPLLPVRADFLAEMVQSGEAL